MMVLPLKIFAIIISASVNIVFIFGTVAFYNMYGRYKHPMFTMWFIVIGGVHIVMMTMVYMFDKATGADEFAYLHDPIAISLIFLAFTFAYYLIPRMARAFSNPESYKVEGFRELAKYYFVLSLSAALYVFWFSLTLFIIITH